MTNVKFMWNGIKIDGELHKGHYSKGSYWNLPDGTITIYAREYKRFPHIEGLEIQNNSDSQTDYFENDRIRVLPDAPLYSEVLTAYEKQEAHRIKTIEKRKAKRAGV